MHDVIVDAVFDVGRIIFRVEKSALVGFVFREQEFWTAFAVKPAAAVVVVVELDRRDLRRYVADAAAVCVRPDPQDQVLRNQRVGSRWSSAGSGPRLNASSRIKISSGPPLAYSTKHIEIAVLVEDSCVDQFELEISLAPPAIFLEQSRVGKFGAEDICRETSCTNASVSNRDRNSTP